MSEDLVTVVFRIGRFLMLAPSYDNSTKCLQKWFTYIFVVVNIIATIKSSYFKVSYEFFQMKAIVSDLMNINILVFTCFTPLNVILWKQKNWKKLLNDLKIIIVFSKNYEKIKKQAKLVIIRFLIEFFILFLVFIFWLQLFGWSYLKIYNIHYFQYYLIYSFNTFLSFILYIILVQYKQINAIFTSDIKCLEKVEKNIYVLKNIVDNFNNIFGWPLALIILYLVLYILTNLDLILEALQKNDTSFELRILADAVLILETIVGPFVVIIFCDFIVREAEIILNKCTLLLRNCNCLSEKEKLEKFTEDLLQNFPRFSAANFFDINRYTILQIINTIITFFIVLMQF